jgi:hypothetical protein
MLESLKKIVLLLVLFLANPAALTAYENPQSGTTTVTATVAGEPDAPTLISPTNNSVINSTTPSFIFSPSLGSILINHYDLYIDGAKNTSPIGQSLTTIVTQAQAALSEGTHTWYIMAVANSGRTRNSATWTFTIDTTAPFILVDGVAGQETNLSSLDPAPWQDTVVFTTNQRYPVITGQGEAGATLTITFSKDSTSDTVSMTIGADRRFSLKPNTALRLGRYSVLVASTDPAGNTTSLPPFYLDIIPGVTPITIALPSPLPDLSFRIPVIVPLSLAELPTIFPLIPSEAINYWIWLVIVSYLCHIYCLNRLFSRLYLHHNIKGYHLLVIYITMLIPTLILSYISINLRHWLPISLTLLSVFTLLYEVKLIQSKDIKIEQI